MKINSDKVFVGAIVLAFAFGIASLGSVFYTARRIEKIEGDFFDRCAAACAPNSVHSTQYKRCTCNAMVVVKDVE